MISFLIRLLLTILVNVGVLWLVSLYFFDTLGFSLSPMDQYYWPGLLFIGIVFWFIDSVLGFIIKTLTLPLSWLTLGLSSIVVNVGLLYIFQYIVNNYIDILYTVQLGTFAQTLILSLVLSILIGLVRFIVRILF